jgi:hypothetical protein
MLLLSEASRTILLLLCCGQYYIFWCTDKLLLGVWSWYPSHEVSGPAVSSWCLWAGCCNLDVFYFCSECWLNGSQPGLPSFYIDLCWIVCSTVDQLAKSVGMACWINPTCRGPGKGCFANETVRVSERERVLLQWEAMLSFRVRSDGWSYRVEGVGGARDRERKKIFKLK